MFAALFTSSVALGIATAYVLLSWVPLGEFRAIAIVAAAIVFVYLFAFLEYRVFLRLMPLREGREVRAPKDFIELDEPEMVCRRAFLGDVEDRLPQAGLPAWKLDLPSQKGWSLSEHG